MEITFQNAIKQDTDGNTQFLLEKMSLLEEVCAEVKASLMKSRTDINPETQQAITAISAYKLGKCTIENWVDLNWGTMETRLLFPSNELVERYISIYGKPVKVK